MRPASLFRHWLPLALISIMSCGLVYLAVQQDERQSANDPQIQMAEDAAAALAKGTAPSVFLPTTTVDIAESLAPFEVVYDDSGKPIAASGNLDNAPPTLPSGVFDYVKTHGEDRVTWQPRSDIRIAAVVTRVSGNFPGYVLAGRSLREVEQRESQLELQIAVALAAMLIASLFAVAVFKKD